jgi:uncharacterized protein
MPLDESPDRLEEPSLSTDEIPPGGYEDLDEPLDSPPAQDVPPAPLAPPATPAPVESEARLTAVDVLRGFALCGILAMNIVNFGWPQSVYNNPTDAPGYGWADSFLWMFNHIFFDTKMMTIFSMLFGAGLVLMSDRAEAKGASLRKVYYRRVLILLAIGLIHAYLVWEGDILVPYALCGLLLYPLRKKSPRTLIVTAVVLLSLVFPLWGGVRAAVSFAHHVTQQVDAEIKEGKTPAGWKKSIHDAWTKSQEENKRDPAKFQKVLDTYRGGYGGIVVHRAKQLVWEQTLGFVLGFWWMVGGRMLLGMGLMKMGVFSAALPRPFYVRLALIGYGIGLPLVLADVAIDFHYKFFNDAGMAYINGGWWLINSVSSPFMALGHIAVVMMICQAGALPWLTRRLAAMGRMALTNYLTQSIVCSTLFYGYGLDLYGTLYRPGLYLVVLAIWAFQLWISPIWLERYRFGPAEWVWRSLTYGKAQPFRRAIKPAPVEQLA